jgi:hypothetical protein
MKNLFKLILYLVIILASKTLSAQEMKDLSKIYKTVSASYPLPDKDDQNFPDIDFRFGWNKTPSMIAVQFINHSYSSKKIKFAIKDLTSGKMIVLDNIHNSHFGSETLKENSESAIWAGPVDDIRDSFSLHVWNSNGDEFDKAPISIKNQQ